MSDREYPARPIVGIGIVVIRDDSVLLVRRGKPPNVGAWTSLAVPRKSARPPSRQHGANCSKRPAWKWTRCISRPPWTISGATPTAASASITQLSTSPARWVSGEPIAATDVTEAVWAKLDALDNYGLWSEAHRVIAIARRLVD